MEENGECQTRVSTREKCQEHVSAKKLDNLDRVQEPMKYPIPQPHRPGRLVLGKGAATVRTAHVQINLANLQDNATAGC
jgi:hypothetical protein